MPALRIVPPYYDHPAYLDAMAAVIREDLAKLAVAAGPLRPQLSRHPDQVRPARRSLCHARQADDAGAGRAARLAARPWTQSFQSLFGRDRWLKPYTDETLQRPGRGRASSASSSPCRASRPTAWRRSTRSATRRGSCSSTPAARSCTLCRA